MPEVVVAPTLPEPSHSVEMSSVAVTAEAGGATCGHCGSEQLGMYCHTCGQRHLEERITFGLLWREFAQRFLKLERGLLRTFRDLLLRPGVVARSYVDGMRRPYVNPLSYLLIATALAVLLLPFYAGMVSEAFDPTNERIQRQMEVGMQMRGHSLQELSPEQLDRVNSTIVRLGTELPKAISDLTSVLYLAFALLLAGALRLFMAGRNREFNFAETLVFTLFVSAQMAIIGSVLAVFAYPHGQTIAFVSSIVLTGIIVLHGVRGFYDRTAGAFILGLLSVTVAYVVYMVLVTGTAIPLAMYRVMQAG